MLQHQQSSCHITTLHSGYHVLSPTALSVTTGRRNCRACTLAQFAQLGAAGLAAPAAGSNVVEQVRHAEVQQRVAINDEQWFSGISRADWEMQIGGYQPLEKWLKDRKGRTLSFEDMQHYMRVVVALRETRRIMAAIDDVLVLPVA
ncbi:hypothetical protein HC928_07480 [bacterium]|nr:hypothetical protein [bacterium]